MVYAQYPLPTGFKTFADLFTYTNTVSGQMFGITFLIATWMILFLAMKGFQTEKAATAASTITAIVGILLSGVGVVPIITILPLMALVVVCLFIEGS